MPSSGLLLLGEEQRGPGEETVGISWGKGHGQVPKEVYLREINLWVPVAHKLDDWFCKECNHKSEGHPLGYTAKSAEGTLDIGMQKYNMNTNLSAMSLDHVL